MTEMSQPAGWRTVDIVVAAVIAVAFGVVFWAWNVVSTDPGGKTSNFQYCIGVADSLPRRIRSTSPQGNFEITYWDWNKNISINPPSQ